MPRVYRGSGRLDEGAEAGALSSAAIRKLRRVVFIALGLYIAAAAALALWGCIDHLEPADAIVVPGNTVAPDGKPSPRLRARRR